ncbi:LacI family DNA-binding transcriptional regulator [Sphingomonas sp. CJ99]
MKTSRRRQGSPTVQDVAVAAGVSAMTVSRVVNGGTNVREATRTAVLQAIERLNYRPNTAARNLAAGEATQIGLFYANPSAGYLSQLLIGTLNAARKSGCHVVLESCEGESDEELAEATRQLAATEVQGVLIPAPLSENRTVRTELEAAGLPYASISLGQFMPGSLNVRIDDYAAARAMTDHLLRLGHREIAFILGNPNQVASAERYRGFCDAMADAGLNPSAARVERGDFTFRSGMEAAERILDSRSRPTALFASNDDMAAAAVGVAHRLGLHVPADISIVGFDDTAIATSIWPELTTIRQPTAQMAEHGVALLLRRISGRHDDQGVEGHDQIVPFVLIERESAGPPPKR